MSSSLDLSRASQERLLEFIGYGRIDAPVWFIGINEGTGVHANLSLNLATRAQHFERVMDVRKALDLLGVEAPTTQVWKFMAKLVLGLKGQAFLGERKVVSAYVRDHLGRQDGETLLTELFPLPSPNANDWPVELQLFYPTRVEYEREMTEVRGRKFQAIFEHQTPKVVVCYGKVKNGRQLEFEHFFAQANFRTQSDLPSKFKIAEVGKTVVVLSPFFGQGQMRDDMIQSLANHLRSRGIQLESK